MAVPNRHLVIQNTVSSQGTGDSQFNLSDLNGFNDPTTTAVVGINVPISRKGSLAVNYGPFEARDQGSYTEDVNFGGELFAAGTMLDSSWRFYDFSLMYNHVLADTPRWGLTGTLGAGVMYSYATLATQDGATSALVDDESFYPFVALRAEYRLNPRWALEANAGGMTISDDWILDTGGRLIWRPTRAWDVAMGYKYFSRKIESDTFYNKVNYNIPFVSISRFW